MGYITKLYQRIIAKVSHDANWSKVQCLLVKLAHAQKELRMHEEFWNNSADAFLLVSCPDGAVLDANPAASSLYGYPHDILIAMNLESLTLDSDSTRTVYADRIRLIPLRIHRNADGRLMPITATISYFNDQGRDVAACIIRPILSRRSSDLNVGGVKIIDGEGA